MNELRIYRSSAGSGKTYMLVLEYLKLVLRNPKEYRHILAITFTNKAAEEMKVTAIPEADAVIVFNCAGRNISLGPLINKQIEGLKKVWNATLVGMISYGELGRAEGGSLEMHNLTTCCVALKEKD